MTLTHAEMQALEERLGRPANNVELEIVGAEWSEHCSYKSSKKQLRRLPTSGSNVLIGPGYDAGVLDVGNGYVITVHIESHNHPSAIEPFGGAATGVGGVLRDIMSMGTRPIALLNALRFGQITDDVADNRSKAKWLFRNVVRGIADYGNCMGIPTVGGEVEFDISFSDYCLVDVAAIGFGKKEELIRNGAAEGDLLILAGGSTGRDGIHGASFASKNLEEENRSAVQIPDPFLEKLVLEATMEAVSLGIIKTCKDLGGGGLACCLSETSDSVGLGFEVDLENVHTREAGMSPAELMISESQERMLFIIAPKSLESLKRIFQKYELKHSVIGAVASHKDLVVRYNGIIVARMPSSVVAHAPLLDRPSSVPAKFVNSSRGVPGQPSDLSKPLLSLLGSLSISSKKWVYNQFDNEVGLRTVLKPGQSDASVLRLDNGKLLAVKLDGNSKHCFLDPYIGTMGCLSEGCRNVICTGAEPIGVVDHLQFANPEDSEIFWSFTRAVDAIVEFCNFTKIPVVGGKVSLYNETHSGPIKPSPVIGTLGLISDPSFVTSSGLKSGDVVFLIGETLPEMGGSEYYESYHKFTGGDVPAVDLYKDRRNGAAVKSLIEGRLINSAHDCSKGGLAVALCEMAIQGCTGISAELDTVAVHTEKPDELFFSESNSRYLVGTSEPQEVRRILEDSGLAFAELGTASGKHIRLQLRGNEITSISLSRAQKAYDSLEKLVS